MPSTPAPASWRGRILQDAGTIGILALLLIPFYLLLNQYWKSLMLLVAVYAVLGLLFLRLGRYLRRVMRRMPAEIPPWRRGGGAPPQPPLPAFQFGAAEAIQGVSKDPYYLQDVLKPRLRQLLMHRVCGNADTTLETLHNDRPGGLDPTVLAFLQRREHTHVWARYCYRRQRVRDVLMTLRYLETL